MFSTYYHGDELKICLAERKKLLLYVWERYEFVSTKTLSIPDTPKSLIWCGAKLCVGYKREYNLIDVQTGSMIELFPTRTPLASPLTEDQILLQKNNISLFIGHDGKPTRRFGLTWSDSPLALSVSSPYVATVHSKCLEVRLMFGELTQLQSVNIPNVSVICSGYDASFYVATKSRPGKIYRLNPIDFNTQISQLQESGKYKEALSIIENLDRTQISNRKETINSLQLSNAYHLFMIAQFGSAMQLFYNLETDPLQVISLFPNFLPRPLNEQYSMRHNDILLKELEGNSLASALIALCEYLENFRDENEDRQVVNGNIPWDEVTDRSVIIDTTLLKAYTQTNPSMISKFLMRPNSCHTARAEATLRDFSKFKELTLLYKGKGLHRKALELLFQLGSSTKENQLLGTGETIAYMSELGNDHIDLIKEFSKWVMERTPGEGLKIFTAKRLPYEALDVKQIVGLLEDMVNNVDTLSPSIVIEYLEFVISELNDQTDVLHNKLVFYYMDKVLELRNEYSDFPNIRNKIAGTEPGELGIYHGKLINFLEESHYYIPEKMLTRYKNEFRQEGLYEERAILRSKIGDHFEALRVYVHEMNDFYLAQTYCENHIKEEEDVYLYLLKVFLTPPDENPNSPSQEELTKAVYDLLNNHHMDISTTGALEVLPEDTPIESLYTYFESILRHTNEKKRNSLVNVNILSSEERKVKAELINLRSRVITINEDTVCPLCDIKIGDSVFAYYPNGRVICYRCWKKSDPHVCPITGTRFGDNKE
eukprot:TRINITY_DN3456_c0_g1_i2.p1 TRINITY_DN3456_c0_g1~~TRINITY_DN3456_c0_g1_i2.p1  ORF type:complete len:767 (-),score=140.41 TRINITY_DN3456_c0_g1_i2:83-2383(-)